MTHRPSLIAALACAAFGASAFAQTNPEWSQHIVRQAEQALAQKQFITGPVDGRMDPQTRFGLQNFQRAWDLAPTGELNGETLAALGLRTQTAQQGASAGGSSAQASRLYSPQTVHAVEQALQQRNYSVGPVNGQIEPATQYGLRQFQIDQGLAPTGNFNMETLSALGVSWR